MSKQFALERTALDDLGVRLGRKLKFANTFPKWQIKRKMFRFYKYYSQQSEDHYFTKTIVMSIVHAIFKEGLCEWCPQYLVESIHISFVIFALHSLKFKNSFLNLHTY